MTIKFLYLINKVKSEDIFNITNLKASKKTDQLMFVIPMRKNSSLASLFYYIKENKEWKIYFVSEAFIGRDGLGLQSEDDVKTPVGIFNFTKFFGIADDPGTKKPYIKINESLYWVSDPKSPKYNQMVNIETFKDFDRKKGEHLIEQTVAYKYAMNINYNPMGIPGKGSAIFLHCAGKYKYTMGCVALPEKNMLKVIKTANEKALIIIDYFENIHKY